jgi:hypothetical protein
MALSWAGRRKALVIVIIASVAVAFLAALAFSVFYQTPTCFDQKQNQDELGVDCGGSCTTLCKSQVGTAPIVRFVRPLAPQPGRTDIIAYIDNPNGAATANAAPFTLEVYGADRALIAKKDVTVDLPAATTVPLYLADVVPTGAVAAQAFLSFNPDRAKWTRAAERAPIPQVDAIVIQDGERPRVTATLVNPIAKPFYNVTLVATVFDPAGNAIAASQTFVGQLAAQGTSPLTFTWNVPFGAPNPRVEIVPVLDVRVP